MRINPLGIFRSFAVGGVTSLLLFATVIPAQADSPPNTASPDISTMSGVAAENFWTPQRLRSAIPADLVVAQRPTTADAAAEPRPAARPVTVPPVGGQLPAIPRNPDNPSAPDVQRPYTNLPDRLNGKVFFTSGGALFVCSGTVVNSRNKSMVDTAGHCVSDGAGNFHENWIFIPGYSSDDTGCKSDGCYPYGIWSARRLTVRTQWHKFANFKQDLGYAILDKLDGKRIVDLIGGQGTAFNRPTSLRWTVFGYPQEPPYDGFDQEKCLSRRFAGDNPSDGPGPLTIGITCDLTGGASGGGWLAYICRRTGLGFVNGHISYRYFGVEESEQLYGPYYGTEALSLFRFTEAR